MTVQRATVMTSTTSPNGYRLYLSMTGTSNDLRRTGGDEIISHATGTFDSPQALTTGTWGYAIPSGTEHIVANHFDPTYDVQESAYPATTKFAAPPISTATAQLITSTSSANETEDDEPVPDELSIYYGVNADDTTTLGTYTGSVLFTAVADAAQTPGVTVSPNSGSTLGGETITVATTLYATNDVDADIYMLTNTQYADVSTTPANISNYSSAKMTCSKTAATAVTYTCTAPANTAGSNYHVYVNVPRYDIHYKAGYSYIANQTVTISNNNTTSSKSSLSVPYGGSVTVRVTPGTNKYLSSVSCPSGYTCTGYSTGVTKVYAQTVTVKNNRTATGGTLSFTGGTATLSNITKMQEMTFATCNNTTTGTSKTLTDTRDNKTYTVKKLNDGRCWMTQSLRITNKTLTPSDSDVSKNFTLPASSTNGWCTDNTEACINRANVLNSGYSDSSVYYSWYAATAGTGTYELTSGNAESSICPKGWRLPTGGPMSDNGEFATLYSYYNSYTAMTNTSGPYFRLAGYYGGTTNTYGRYWGGSINTAYALPSVLSINSSPSAVYPSDGGYKYRGFNARCINANQ